ncbi:alpha-L-fucosidase [Klebsiella aerogenes]|uniref:alpha-L-fucosidase n=1 Tax=Klebsiella aerogenes TaxID=548 RepID=UPI0034D226C7
MSNTIFYFESYTDSNVSPSIESIDNYSTTDYSGNPLSPNQQSVVNLPEKSWLKFQCLIPTGDLASCMLYTSTITSNQKIEIRISSPDNSPTWNVSVSPVGIANYFTESYSSSTEFDNTNAQDVYFYFPDGFNGALNWFVFFQNSGTETNEHKLRRMKWFTDARFGHMMHWGAYSVLAQGEWIMNNDHIPKDEYIQEACIPFDPQNYDPDYWSDVIINAGQKYLTITTKHHDGFAMFNTNVVDFAPYDVVNTASIHTSVLKPLAEYCKSKGIYFCCYYSLLDWGNTWEVSIENEAADPDNINPDDITRYLSEMKEQLKELIEIFDPVLIWFDGAWAAFLDDDVSQEIVKFLRSLSPDIIINNRVGGSYGDYNTPEQSIPAGTSTDLWETCMTINNSWGYNSSDNNWKSTPTLLNDLLDCVSKGGNYLLNTGPTADGIIPQPSLERLSELGEWLAIWGRAVYETRAGTLDVSFQPGCYCTLDKNNTLYITVTQWPADNLLRIDAPLTLPAKCYWLNDISTLLTWQIIDGMMVVSLPATPVDELGMVLAMEFDDLPQPRAYPDKAILRKATASDIWNNNVEEYGPQFAVDGNSNTRWATDESPVWLEVDLGALQEFTRVTFSQYDQRIDAFSIDAFINDSWQTILSGNTPAQNYTGYLNSPVTAEKIRLNIQSVISSDQPASLYSFTVLDANDQLLPVNIPVDLARGSSATASNIWYNDETDYSAMMVVDGNPSTRWAANDNPDLPVTISVDFIRETIFDIVKVDEYIDSNETTSRIADFTLQISSDGENWVDAYQGSDITSPIVLPYLTSATAVRIIINGLTGTSGPSIYSIAVMQTARDIPETLDDDQLLELESRQCFEYFWREANLTQGSPGYGLISDTNDSRRATIANTGFGLSSFVIAAERGWIDYQTAQTRCQLSLESLLNSVPQYKGFFYHFIDMDTLDTQGSEVSTVDTMLALNGILTVGQYFGSECATLAQQIFDRVEWSGAVAPDGYFTMAWDAEGVMSTSTWSGYAEQFCMYPMAAGSTTYPPIEGASLFYDLTYQHGNYGNSNDIIYVWDGALFTYQFSHAWIDFRKCEDRNGVDWWQNSVNASTANYQFCIDNNDVLPSLDKLNWGLTACNGPEGYDVYGTPPSGRNNQNNVHYTDGTVTPSGPLGSLPFLPEETLASARVWYQNPRLWTSYGFSEAFNTSTPSVWYCPKISGLIKGVTILMIENYRSNLIWNTYMSHPVLQRGLPVIFDMQLS